MATRAKKQARKMRAAANDPVLEHKMESPQSVETEFVPVAKPKRRWKPRKKT